MLSWSLSSAAFAVACCCFAYPLVAGADTTRPVLDDAAQRSRSGLEPEFILPSLVLPSTASVGGAAAGEHVFVHEYRVVGSTVLTTSEIDEITRPYRGRMVSYADLESVRDALTRAYVTRGYLTSGAWLPEQSIRAGSVRIVIEEGVLEAVSVSTDGRLASAYVEGRLRPEADQPLNLADLQRRLRELQADRLVRAVRARLLPGEARGRARLDVEIDEERPYALRLELDNGLSPSIGAERSRIAFEHLNVSGLGDALELAYAQSTGLRELRAAYSAPLTHAGTRIELEVRTSESRVTEEPFDELDIDSRAATYGVRLRHPVWETSAQRFSVSLAAEYRRSKSFLLGSAFSFSPGAESGESRISVVRFAQDLSLADRAQALALRSTVSVGIGALGATTQSDSRLPDSRFVAWLGQVQYARRLEWADAQLVARADVQLSNDPLLGLEQFGVGGRFSVRGYRENVRVRDNGAIGSLELRVPVWNARGGSLGLELAPFVDVGSSWNREAPERGGKTIASAGLGARLTLGWTSWEVYWAEALRDVRLASDERDLQDRGFHVRMTARF